MGLEGHLRIPLALRTVVVSTAGPAIEARGRRRGEPGLDFGHCREIQQGQTEGIELS